MSKHSETIDQEDTAIRKLIAWQGVALYVGFSVLLSYSAFSLWSGYTNQIWQEPALVFATWAIEKTAAAFGLLIIMNLVLIAIKLLRRSLFEQTLRFDVYVAVTEVLGAALSRHLSDYQKLTTVLDVGQELLKPAEQMSRRAARIELALQAQLPGLGLAEAIDQIVRNALKANDVANTVSNVETILTRIEHEGQADNIVQLEQRPTA